MYQVVVFHKFMFSCLGEKDKEMFVVVHQTEIKKI